MRTCDTLYAMHTSVNFNLFKDKILHFKIRGENGEALRRNVSESDEVDTHNSTVIITLFLLCEHVCFYSPSIFREGRGKDI